MNYQFRFSDKIPISWVQENLPGLVFPNILARADRIQKPFLGVLAIDGSKPIGMILGLPDQTKKTIRIASFKVNNDESGKGLAQGLLNEMEKEVKSRGFRTLEILFREPWIDFDKIKHILNKLNWGEPFIAQRHCQATLEQALPVFHSDTDLPEGFSIKSWEQLSKADLHMIRERQQKENWFPQELSPFQFGDLIEPNHSLGLLFQKQIIGWHIVAKISKETLEHSCLFIDPVHRKFKITHLVMGESIRRQLAIGVYPKFVFSVAGDNSIMMRFVERNGAVNGMKVTDEYQSIKKIL